MFWMSCVFSFSQLVALGVAGERKRLHQKIVSEFVGAGNLKRYKVSMCKWRRDNRFDFLKKEQCPTAFHLQIFEKLFTLQRKKQKSPNLLLS